MLFVMDDGLRLEVRPIRPSDKPLLAAGYLRLSDEAKRLRFLAPKARLSVAELRYLTEVDGRDHAAFVAVRHDRAGGPQIVAAARYVRLADEPDTAEFAIAIADDLQGHGLGGELARLIAREARRHGIRRFRATVLRENAAIHALMATIVPELEQESAGHGVEELVGRLAA